MSDAPSIAATAYAEGVAVVETALSEAAKSQWEGRRADLHRPRRRLIELRRGVPNDKADPEAQAVRDLLTLYATVLDETSQRTEYHRGLELTQDTRAELDRLRRRAEPRRPGRPGRVVGRVPPAAPRGAPARRPPGGRAPGPEAGWPQRSGAAQPAADGAAAEDGAPKQAPPPSPLAGVCFPGGVARRARRALLVAAVSLACTDTAALAAPKEPVHSSCTVPAMVRYLDATFADANAGRTDALVARLDARPRHFLAWTPYFHVDIRPAPRLPSIHARVQRVLIGRYAARRAAAGEELALTGVFLEGRRPGRGSA